MKFLMLLFILLNCISCAHRGYMSNKSDRQYYKDITACRASVGQAREPAYLHDDLMDECMLGKGYEIDNGK